MKIDNYIRNLEIKYRIEINKNLRKAIAEHFEENLNIYTEQDLYDENRKIIQEYKYFK